MNIYPVKFNNYNSFNYSNSPSFSNSLVGSLERNDYKQLRKEYNVRASSLFRRGVMYGSPSDDYKDVENALEYLYSKNKVNNMLVIGVGEAQEPLSLAASVYSINYFDNLKDVLDMHCVDLGPQLTNNQISKSAVVSRGINQFACDSTCVTSDGVVLKDEIQDFVMQTLNSDEKTQWNTSIQEYLETCPKNEYNCVSINNVIDYIPYKEHESLINNLGAIVKPDGILITDSYLSDFIKEKNLLGDFEEINPGIYKKNIPLQNNFDKTLNQMAIYNTALFNN